MVAAKQAARAPLIGEAHAAGDPEFRQGGIEKSFARITEEVRTQYTAGYYSHEPILDGKYRKVEVQVLRPGLTVIAKEGYYPSAGDAPARTNTTPTATP